MRGWDECRITIGFPAGTAPGVARLSPNTVHVRGWRPETSQIAVWGPASGTGPGCQTSQVNCFRVGDDPFPMRLFQHAPAMLGTSTGRVSYGQVSGESSLPFFVGKLWGWESAPKRKASGNR